MLLLVVLFPALVTSFVTLHGAYKPQQQPRHSSLRMIAAAPKVRSTPFILLHVCAFIILRYVLVASVTLRWIYFHACGSPPVLIPSSLSPPLPRPCAL